MNNISSNLRLPAIISTALVVPFMILEVVNKRRFDSDFPIVLFVMMWLLPAAFIVILAPVVRNMRQGGTIPANPLGLLLCAVFLVAIAWLWVSIVVDQMPCFLGVPNCD